MRLIAACLAVQMAALCCTSALAASTDQPTVFSESSTGSKRTRPFTVEGSWELRWTTSGGILVVLHKRTGELVDAIAQTQKAGPGASFHPTGGTYYLDITAAGDWTVSVVPVP